MPETIFCPNCRRDITAKVYKTPTFTGEIIIEYICPKHGTIRVRRQKMKLPERKPPKQGLYISIEGIDGSGKTLHAKQLVKYLRDRGYRVILVKQPYVGAIKEYLYNHQVDPDAETYLFAADRIILHKEVINPALQQGKIVVSDRSIYTSLAYQAAQGVDPEFIKAINRKIRLPDKTILLDIPAEEALKRIQQRKQKTKYQTKQFLEKARQNYIKLAQQHKNKILIIDATAPIQQVQRKIRETIEQLLNKR